MNHNPFQQNSTFARNEAVEMEVEQNKLRHLSSRTSPIAIVLRANKASLSLIFLL